MPTAPFSDSYQIKLHDHFLRINNCTELDFLAQRQQESANWKRRNAQRWLVSYGAFWASILTVFIHPAKV
jgi:hypothetical protein